MSYDLIAWKAPRVTDEEEAARLVKRYFDSDDATPFSVSSDVEGFYADLMKKYPLPDPANPYHVASDQTRWAMECEPSDRVVMLNLSWGTPGEVVDESRWRARAIWFSSTRKGPRFTLLNCRRSPRTSPARCGRR